MKFHPIVSLLVEILSYLSVASALAVPPSTVGDQKALEAVKRDSIWDAFKEAARGPLKVFGYGDVVKHTARNLNVVRGSFIHFGQLHADVSH